MLEPSESPFLYQEKLPQVRREFRLFKDRVEVEADWTLGKRHAMTVKLADLSGQTRTFTVRNKWFKKAILVGSMAVAAALVFSRSGYSPAMRRVAGFGWPVAGIAGAVAVLSARKRSFVHLPRRDGRPGLDICRTDPEAFDAFLRELQVRIPRA